MKIYDFLDLKGHYGHVDQLFRLAVYENLDPLKTLEIEHLENLEQATSKFRELARRWHPDINKDPNAEEKFKQINDAYQRIKENPNSYIKQDSHQKMQKVYDRTTGHYVNIPEGWSNNTKNDMQHKKIFSPEESVQLFKPLIYKMILPILNGNLYTSLFIPKFSYKKKNISSMGIYYLYRTGKINDRSWDHDFREAGEDIKLFRQKIKEATEEIERAVWDVEKQQNAVFRGEYPSANFIVHHIMQLYGTGMYGEKEISTTIIKRLLEDVKNTI